MNCGSGGDSPTIVRSKFKCVQLKPKLISTCCHCKHVPVLVLALQSSYYKEYGQPRPGCSFLTDRPESATSQFKSWQKSTKAYFPVCWTIPQLLGKSMHSCKFNNKRLKMVEKCYIFCWCMDFLFECECVCRLQSVHKSRCTHCRTGDGLTWLMYDCFVVGKQT